MFDNKEQAECTQVCTFVARVLIYAIIKFDEVYGFVYKTVKEIS